MPHELLDYFPIWGFFLATVVIILLSLEGGFQLGTYRRKHSEQEKEASVGAIVGTTLGLLAFLLAFTFGLAATRFDARRQVLLDEANAIGTTYLRAGLLNDPYGPDFRQMLREYVDVRLEGVDPDKVEQALIKSEALHNKLWTHAEKASGTIPTQNPVMFGLFIQSLNEVIDLHAKRVQVAMRSRIPSVIWVALFSVAILGMAGMGYQAGLSGTSRSIAALVLVLAFAAVLVLIADLDRPQEGLLRVSQQPLLDLRKSMTLHEH